MREKKMPITKTEATKWFLEPKKEKQACSVEVRLSILIGSYIWWRAVVGTVGAIKQQQCNSGRSYNNSNYSDGHCPHNHSHSGGRNSNRRCLCLRLDSLSTESHGKKRGRRGMTVISKHVQWPTTAEGHLRSDVFEMTAEARAEQILGKKKEIPLIWIETTNEQRKPYTVDPTHGCWKQWQLRTMA